MVPQIIFIAMLLVHLYMRIHKKMPKHEPNAVLTAIAASIFALLLWWGGSFDEMGIIQYCLLVIISGRIVVDLQKEETPEFKVPKWMSWIASAEQMILIYLSGFFEPLIKAL